MKGKKIVSIIALFVASVAFASCANVNNRITFKEYWFENVGVSHIVGGEETLVYDVEFKKGDGLSTNGYSVEYTNGVLETKLTLEENYYVYATALTVDVTYIHGANTLTATDTTTSWVKFKNVASLQPIASHKEIVNHTLNADGSKLVVYDYTVDTEYAEDLKTGKTKIVNRSNETTEEKTFAIADDYTYLDNEQLLFALRGLKQSTSGDVSVYAPFSAKVQTIKVQTNAKVEGEEFSFLKNGTKIENAVVPYFPVDVSINAQSSGATQTVWIAETSNTSVNTYRNVILRLETPLSHNLGTLIYKLKSANFITQ